MGWTRVDVEALVKAVDELLAKAWMPIDEVDKLIDLLEPFYGLDWADSLDHAATLYEPWGASPNSEVGNYLVDGSHLRLELLAARREIDRLRLPAGDDPLAG